MQSKMSKKNRVALRRENHKKVQEAVAESKADEARRPDPIDSKLLDGEMVEIVGPADAPTTSQIHRFRGLHGTALPPYIAPNESTHCGKTMRPVKVNGKIVGIPEDRLRSLDRGHGPRMKNTSAFRRGWDLVFGRA